MHEINNKHKKLAGNKREMATDSKRSKHSKYCVHIKYTKEVESHDGYCSDPCNKTWSSYEKVKVRPLDESIKSEDIVDGKLKEEIGIELYGKNRKGCQFGSGYCDCYTTYYYHSFKVKPVIDLDDDLD